jgi:phosphonoacetate hydrolase
VSVTVEANGRRYRAPDAPTAVVCLDGCDPRYLDDALERRLLPRLEEMIAAGVYVLAGSQLPSFTNPNNLSIVTGAPPAVHGLPGNHYLAADGAEVQLDDPRFLRAPSIHARLHEAGVPVLAVTTKDKLRRLLAAGGVPCVSVERATEIAIDGLPRASDAVAAPVPSIYEWDASHYALELGLALGQRLGTRLLYVSLTDFVQHREPPGTELSDRFLVRLDELVGRYLDAGWRLGLVADHGMNAKTLPDGRPNVRYLEDELGAAGIPGVRVLLPITDPHVVHHAALGSACWVHLRDRADADRAAAVVASLPGVEEVMDGDTAARELRLPRDRIGDLVVLADRDTVLGKTERAHDLGALGAPLRSHGGRHEQSIPLLLSERPGPAGRDLLAAGATNADVHALLIGAAA